MIYLKALLGGLTAAGIYLAFVFTFAMAINAAVWLNGSLRRAFR